MNISFTEGTCRCGCQRPVGKNSKFGMGHDAKAKAALTAWAVQQGSLDARVVIVENGVERTVDVLTAANELSGKPALTSHIEKAFRRQVERAADRAERKAAKPDGKAKKAETVRARVGRWTYEGTARDGVFTYRDKAGAEKTATSYEIA